MNDDEFEAWDAWWCSLTPAERDAEIALMDAYVADQQRRREEGEPP